MTDWKPGMFYNVGGAAALFWPDQHPCNREPAEQRWIVFEPWGGVEIIVGRLPREDMKPEHEMGWAPFLVPHPEPDREFWREIRDMPTEATQEGL